MTDYYCLTFQPTTIASTSQWKVNPAVAWAGHRGAVIDLLPYESLCTMFTYNVQLALEYLNYEPFLKILPNLANEQIYISVLGLAWSRAVAVLAIIASWTSMKPYSYANTSRQEMWRRWWWCCTVSLSTNVRLHHAYIPHWSLKPYFKCTTNPSPARLWSELFVNVKCSGWWHRLYEEVAVVL